MAKAKRRSLLVGQIYREGDLPALARRAREQVKKTVEEVARELGLPAEEVENAETRTDNRYFDIQNRIIEHCTVYCVVPEVRFRLQRKPCTG